MSSNSGSPRSRCSEPVPSCHRGRTSSGSPRSRRSEPVPSCHRGRTNSESPRSRRSEPVPSFHHGTVSFEHGGLSAPQVAAASSATAATSGHGSLHASAENPVSPRIEMPDAFDFEQLPEACTEAEQALRLYAQELERIANSALEQFESSIRLAQEIRQRELAAIQLAQEARQREQAAVQLAQETVQLAQEARQREQAAIQVSQQAVQIVQDARDREQQAIQCAQENRRCVQEAREREREQQASLCAQEIRRSVQDARELGGLQHSRPTRLHPLTPPGERSREPITVDLLRNLEGRKRVRGGDGHSLQACEDDSMRIVELATRVSDTLQALMQERRQRTESIERRSDVGEGSKRKRSPGSESGSESSKRSRPRSA